MAREETDNRARFTAWFGWSRPPFHTIGIIPFFLGTFLAWRLDHVFDAYVFILGLGGILLVMVSTDHAGRYLADAQDERNGRLFRNRLTVNSGAITDDRLPRSGPLRTSIIAIALAGIVGLILQFGLKTGHFTLLLGFLIALPGFFYSNSPVRLVDRGFGEFFISLFYGWLPAAAGFYLQRGYIPSSIHWMALPIGLSIFNVILLSEFREHTVDTAMGKTNLLARLGKTKGTALYGLASILSWLCMIASLNSGIPGKALYIYLPVMALSAVISIMMARKKYENHLLLELINGFNIAVYLGTTVAYILAFL
jgi:1,4-dihydroxy-2-naphthoate octaprenyltransferase